jgi:hypothetical protein
VEPQVIKFLLVPGVILAVLLSLRSRASLRGQARRKILAVLTVIFGVLAVIFPDLMQLLADFVGVDRGTDLLLYGLALVIIYFVGSSGVRFREQEARLVRLARAVALAEADLRWSDRRHALEQESARPQALPAPVHQS